MSSRHGKFRSALASLKAASAAAIAALVLMAGAAEARLVDARSNIGAGPGKIVIEIDKSTQRMTVTVDGEKRYTFRVSTGRAGYETPVGGFRALVLKEMHYSRKYDNAPMPHSIFFTNNGHAIHATSAVGRLGRTASHGCIRLSPKDAKTLYDLVERHGMKHTSIRITGVEPKARVA
ncbi:MAG: L,D-transpeptidase [Alphaproteobacteria bacterium]